MNVTDYDYHLPEELIAQEPVYPRDSSKLMHLDRQSNTISHYVFADIIELLNPGDVLVMNNTRVIPARLSAYKAETGGKVEILLLNQIDETQWQALIGGRNVNKGMILNFENSDIHCEIIDKLEASERIIRFSRPVNDLLGELGEMPLPPYIHTQLEDNERYQTIYSKVEGSAAAPTAGLHFTPDLLINLSRKGIKLAYCTLHIGLDTFQPVKVDKVEDHKIHTELAILDSQNAKLINDAKLSGGRIIAVGTTSARTLETAGILSAGGDPANPEASNDVCAWRPVIAFEQNTSLFIYPGYKWRVLDAMITNFHLPKSTLLMMLSAFSGRETMLNAYEIAKQEHYRFYSFGDAMLIT